MSSCNFAYFITLDSGVPGVSVAISLSFSPGIIPLMGAAPAGFMVLAAVSLQFPNSVSWKSCFLFCQLRSGNPQVLCVGHKQITSDCCLKFTGKFKQGFL